MSEEYTIEQLEKTFKEHAEKFKFQKSLNYVNPTDFNISEALHVICKEINQIKIVLKVLMIEKDADDEDFFNNINVIEEIIKNSGITEDLLGKD